MVVAEITLFSEYNLSSILDSRASVSDKHIFRATRKDPITRHHHLNRLYKIDKVLQYNYELTKDSEIRYPFPRVKLLPRYVTIYLLFWTRELLDKGTFRATRKDRITRFHHRKKLYKTDKVPHYNYTGRTIISKRKNFI